MKISYLFIAYLNDKQIKKFLSILFQFFFLVYANKTSNKKHQN